MTILKNRIIVIAVGLLFSFIIHSCYYSSKAARKLLNKSVAKKYDIIIVPGVPFENLQLSRTMKGRIYWSKFLYERGITKNIMYSGSSVYTPYYEGIIMSLYAEALGIPGKNIFSEIKAEHSTENVYYSYKKAKQLGFEKIALASDPFQTKLLKRYIRKKIKGEVDVIPFVKDSLNAMSFAVIEPVIDYQSAYNKDFISIKKRQNFRKRWRGTRGLNVDTTYYK